VFEHIARWTFFRKKIASEHFGGQALACLLFSGDGAVAGIFDIFLHYHLPLCAYLRKVSLTDIMPALSMQIQEFHHDCRYRCIGPTGPPGY